MRSDRRMIMALLLTALAVAGVMCVSVSDDSGMSDADVYSGSCGDSATWSLDTSTGVLTIGGTGAISDYSTSGGVTTAPWGTYRTYVTAIVIGDSITSIGQNAFYKMNYATSLTIGSGVQSIGNSAFYTCDHLTAIEIPSSVTTIGNYAFISCTSVKTVTLNEGLLTIGMDSFGYLFYLTSIYIPSTVISIDVIAFNYDTALNDIQVSGSNTHYSSVDGLLCSADGSTLLIYPAGYGTDAVIPSSITSIGQNAFYYDSQLVSVTIPASVTSIGNYAFRSCSHLTSVIFLGQPSIGVYSFDCGLSYRAASITVQSTGWATPDVFTSTVIGSYTTVTFSGIIYTVTFEPNNGGDPSVVAVESGNTIGTWPDDPVYTGHAFVGWYSDSACTSLFVTSTAITANITLYAGYDTELVFTTYPTASANVTASSTYDNSVIFSAAGSTNIGTVTWDFGDGTTATGLYVSHTYASPGTYDYTLTVTNDYGSDVSTGTVTASEIPDDADTSDSGSSGLLYAEIFLGFLAAIAIAILAKKVIA